MFYAFVVWLCIVISGAELPPAINMFLPIFSHLLLLLYNALSFIKDYILCLISLIPRLHSPYAPFFTVCEKAGEYSGVRFLKLQFLPFESGVYR